MSTPTTKQHVIVHLSSDADRADDARRVADATHRAHAGSGVELARPVRRHELLQGVQGATVRSPRRAVRTPCRLHRVPCTHAAHESRDSAAAAAPPGRGALRRRPTQRAIAAPEVPHLHRSRERCPARLPVRRLGRSGTPSEISRRTGRARSCLCVSACMSYLCVRVRA